MSFTTYEDVIEHGFDYLGGNPSDAALRDCKRAVLEAYRELINAANWTAYYTHGRIITSAAWVPADATIQYQGSGGTYPRQMTLTGDVWPDWAAEGTYIRVGQVNARTAERKSATVLTLDEEVTFDDDLDAGTEFTLYRDSYLLPLDYIAQDQALFERNFGGMVYTHPREWLYESRNVAATGTPIAYTITGDKQYPGRLTLKVYPWPVEAKSIDFLYKRRPRPLRCYRMSDGKVATTSSSNTITGTGTNFTPDMVGSVLRLANTGLHLPTSDIGARPAAFESIITSWTSATSIATADAPTQTLTGLAYTISDRVDIEEGAMLNAFLRCTEMHLGMVRTLKDKPSARAQYERELSVAKGADSRSFQGRRAGQTRRTRMRLRDYPIDLTQTE